MYQLTLLVQHFSKGITCLLEHYINLFYYTGSNGALMLLDIFKIIFSKVKVEQLAKQRKGGYIMHIQEMKNNVIRGIV